MKAKPKKIAEADLFRSELTSILNDRHELFQLAHLVNWEQLDKQFGELFPSATGCPATQTRLIVGLFYLKAIYHESDEQLVSKWIENPYWQYFCGETYFQHRFPIDPSTLSKWRDRLSETDVEQLLQATIELGLKTKTIKIRETEQVIVDTTVQEKAIAHPTDSRLYHVARKLLVKEAKQSGLSLRQIYERVSRKAYFKANNYGRAQQYQRMKKETKHLKTYLGRVVRNVEREFKKHPECADRFCELLQLSRRLLKQQKTDKHKLYSLHAPEVECIAKGKANKRYEFGVKAGFVSPLKKAFILGAQALPGNPYDGHTLRQNLDQAERLVGRRPITSVVDLGYRKHNEEETEVIIVKRGLKQLTRGMRKIFRRRNAIEPLIGHLKTEGNLSRNYLKGTHGDALNVLFCAIGFNLRQILRKLRLFWLKIIWVLYEICLCIHLKTATYK